MMLRLKIRLKRKIQKRDGRSLVNIYITNKEFPDGFLWTQGAVTRGSGTDRMEVTLESDDSGSGIGVGLCPAGSVPGNP